MAKKQAIATETAAAAAPARAVKPKSPRVTTAKHSKAMPVEPVSVHADPVSSGPEVHHDAIALIAYSYWESRGREHGMHLEDWLRAEREYLNRN